MIKQELMQQITMLVAEFYNVKYKGSKFIQGEIPIKYAGRVFDEKEIKAAVEVLLEFWLIEGRFARQFQSELATIIGVKYVLLVNSGSSANLLVLSALTSHLLKELRLKPGGEVITVAAGFLITVNPIIQNSLVPVFVDKEYEGHIHRHISGNRQRARPLHNPVKLM